MSTAKVLKIRDRILRRGWQLTELYNDDRQCYLTRLSGAIIDVGGEVRMWNLQAFLPVQEIQRSRFDASFVWVQHFEKLIKQADAYLVDAARKVAAGEYLHVEQPQVAAEPGPVEASEDAGRPASDDQVALDSGSDVQPVSGDSVS